MTSIVAGPVSVGVPRTAVLSALFALGACSGDPPTTTPAGGGSGAGQAGTGIAQSGASGSGGMPGGGSGGMGSATGGAGAGGAGGTSGGSAGMPDAGSGGMTAGTSGTNGTSGASGSGSGTSGTAGVSGSGMGATGGMAGGPPSMGGSGAGGANSSGGAGGRALSFEADIWPVFEKIRDPVFVYYGTGAYESCTTGGVCHGGDDPGAGLSMTSRETAYQMLIDQDSTSVLCGSTLRVVAGAPEESCLIAFYEVRLRDELEWVDTAEIDLVREWIAEGALP